MKNIKQTTPKDTVAVSKQRSYSEIVEFLDANWTTNTNDTTLQCIKKLDQAFGSIAQKTNAILVAGTNGKSLTIHFAAKLLKQEGLTVGAFYAPHILTYNELFSLNSELISNKTFTEVGNEVINTAQTIGVTPNSLDILTMMALLYFKNSNCDVAVLEVSKDGAHNPVNICNPKIAAITRLTSDESIENEDAIVAKAIEELTGIVKTGTHVVCADQSKLSLQDMAVIVENKGGIWSMPIRKLAALAYPFEQLHGRCAALAERIAQIYVNLVINRESIIVSGSLLTKQKGQRGRPTIEAKRQSELNPRKTIEQFWKDEQSSLSGRFQLLDKEKPTILLDNASNLDAFKNLLLGIRLLHYKKPLKGLTLIIGCTNPNLNVDEFLKLLRYFFKKTSGQVIVYPVDLMPGHNGEQNLDVEKITNSIKSMQIKAKSSKNFKEAFEAAQKTVDERQGLVVVTGSSSAVAEYWKYKGIKKL
ncbi:MAG: Mur ligase family protein [Candidatus Dependentiae bacterium]|nr:Mur ligase family protein [Candidatus Dependentiae bacterium]